MAAAEEKKRRSEEEGWRLQAVRAAENLGFW